MEARTREWFKSSELAHDACMHLAQDRDRPLWLFVWLWFRRLVLLVMRWITWSQDAAIARAVARIFPSRRYVVSDVEHGVQARLAR